MRIVIASHGTLAAGIHNSAEVILGKKENIETVCCYVEENIDYSKVIEEIVVTHNYEDKKLVVLTDLLGGSVNSEFMKYLNDYNFFLVSGVNLPLLIEIAVHDDLEEHELLQILDNGKANMQMFNKLPFEESEDDDFE